MCLEVVFMKIFSTTLPGIEVKLADLQFPGSCPSDRSNIGFLLVFSNLFHYPKITKIGLTKASASRYQDG